MSKGKSLLCGKPLLFNIQIGNKQTRNIQGGRKRSVPTKGIAAKSLSRREDSALERADKRRKSSLQEGDINVGDSQIPNKVSVSAGIGKVARTQACSSETVE